jgi:hypothetical protein
MGHCLGYQKANSRLIANYWNSYLPYPNPYLYRNLPILFYQKMNTPKPPY